MDPEDVKALEGFSALRSALFAREVTEPGRPFNVVVLSEDVSKGEQVDHWTLLGDGDAHIASGRAIGRRRIRVLDRPVAPKSAELRVTSAGPDLGSVSMKRYFADQDLVRLVTESNADSGETDTAKWMTGAAKETGR